MQAANKLAGYSLGEADLLRRAMGKKNVEEMAKQRERFVQGATQRGYPPKKIEKIFDLMAQFAGYGFNKSHSAAYALLAYHTAYLKTHHPIDFMAALLTSITGDTDRRGEVHQRMPRDGNCGRASGYQCERCEFYAARAGDPVRAGGG
jgi:DNA polymerase III subunit alpha